MPWSICLTIIFEPGPFYRSEVMTLDRMSVAR